MKALLDYWYQIPEISYKLNPFQANHPDKLIIGNFPLLWILQQMKKFKFQSINNKAQDKLNSKLQPAKSKVGQKAIDKAEADKQKKRQQLQKQMKMLEQKINQKDNSAKQANKMLDIDEFLKKQKEKTREYALKLNEQYEKQKKDREVKLYKKYNRGQAGSEKLINITTKNQIPLAVFSAVQQLKQAENNIKKWILDDHHHKLSDMLLDVSKNQYFRQELRLQQEKWLKSKPQNGWKKIKQVSTNSVETKYIPVQHQQNQLQPSDFGQPLISALTFMTKDLSQHLYHQCAIVNKQLYFLLKFYPGGERKSVLTDQFMEVRQYTHKYVNIGSRHKNGLTFWSTLLEKAYKKLYFGQAVLPNLQQAIQNVYGIDAQIIPLNNLTTVKENFTIILNAFLSTSPKVYIGFMNDRTDTYDRIYPLSAIQFPIGQKKKKKKAAQEEVRQDITYTISNPYTGILKSNFINKFAMNQLYQKFNKIVVLREYPERWMGIRIKIEFLSNGPITFTSTDWVKNNQYSFTLSRPVQTRLAFRRAWSVLPESGQKKDEQKLLFGFIIFKSSQGETEVSTMKLQNLIAKVKSNDENGCVLNKYLEKGTYIIIPYSHLVSQQYMQSFNFDIILERQDAVTINKAKIYEYFYENKPSNDQKVIQKLQSRVKYEKPKSEKIILPKLSFDSNNKPLNEKYLQSLGIIVNKESKLSDILIPGKLRPFLVQGEAKQGKKERKQKKSQQDQQLQKYQKQQALKILLGYDALLDQDINHGQMMAILNETSAEIDLSNFYLGEQGAMAIMEALMSVPRIQKLDLSNNDLNDSVITYLCYYLQKGSRKELRELNLVGNRIGKTGVKALRGLKEMMGQLQILGVKL